MAVDGDKVVPDFLISLCAAALQSYRRDSVFKPFPPDFLGADGKSVDFDRVSVALNDIPELRHVNLLTLTPVPRSGVPGLSRPARRLLRWALHPQGVALRCVSLRELHQETGLVLPKRRRPCHVIEICYEGDGGATDAGSVSPSGKGKQEQLRHDDGLHDDDDDDDDGDNDDGEGACDGDGDEVEGDGNLSDASLGRRMGAKERHRRVRGMECRERRRTFERHAAEHGTMFAFHGSSLENVHSIVMRGLRCEYAGRTGQVFGKGVYASTDASVAFNFLSWGKGWHRSAVGQRMACLFVCEIVKHPLVRHGTADDKDFPPTYCLVPMDTLIRPRYVLVYGSEEDDQARSQGKWWIVVLVWVLILLAIGVANNRRWRNIVIRRFS